MLSQWWEPEPMILVPQLASWLADRGHEVKVLTGFPNYPSGEIYDGYHNKVVQRERSGSIEIVRVPLVPSHSESAAGRVANFASFATSAATIGVAALGAVDVAYVYHPPATIGIPAIALKKARGVPFLLHVQDLWPESVVDSGMLSSPRAQSVVGSVLSRSCRALYRSASEIVAISPGFRDALIERGAPDDRVSVVYNWANERLVAQSRDVRMARELGLEGKFVVMYAGNLGPFQGLDTAIRAAHALSDVEGFRLVIVGTGIAETSLRRLASELGVENVTFLGPRPQAEMPGIVSLADLHLVSLRDTPALASTIPGKVQALLAAGQPILMAARGDAADLVTKSGAGWVCEPESVAALSSAIRRIARGDRAALAGAGAAGRGFYDEHLSLDAAASTIEQLLTAMARRA